MPKYRNSKGRSLKRWVVVIFTESKEYSVIPVNWLVQSIDLEEQSNTLINLDSVQFCKWPPFKVTNIELINAIDPDVTWKLFKIKIVDNKIYVNFKQAWSKQVDIETSATENECEALMSNKKRKMSSSSSDDSYIEDGNLSVDPISHKNVGVPYETGESSRHYTKLQVTNDIASIDQQPSYVSQTEAITSFSSTSSAIINAFNEDLNKNYTLENIQECEPYIPTYSSYHHENLIDAGSINHTVTEILTNMQKEQLNIKKELIASNLMLTRLLYKVEVLECNSKNNNLNSVMENQYIDANFLSLFPINDKDGFQLIENNILNELDFVTKLVFKYNTELFNCHNVVQQLMKRKLILGIIYQKYWWLWIKK